MTNLSQRDPRWKNITLGSKGTIGEYGCTITCLSMLVGFTPDVVNERLKAVSGYSQGNLIIWAKIHEAFPQATFKKRGYTYNNDEVKSNVPCLVEVNGAPIGGDKHWVLYVGEGKLVDPWDGKTKSTSSYEAIGYATISVTSPNSTGSTENTTSSMNPCVVTLQTKVPQIENKEVQTILSELEAKDRRIKELESKPPVTETVEVTKTIIKEVFPSFSSNIASFLFELALLVEGKRGTGKDGNSQRV